MKDHDLLAEFGDSTVLVVDDQQQDVDLLVALLNRAGVVRVIGETDASRAIANLPTLRPDLVMLDLHMPRMDGLEALARIAEFAAGSYLPVLLLTADTTRQALQAALSSGAADVVTKPFFTTEVLLRVQNLLRTRGLYRTQRLQHQAVEEELRGFQASVIEETEIYGTTQKRIQEALVSDELGIAVQPIIELLNGTIVGLEALARFPDAASRSADQWFTDAARVGLRPELERHALESALWLVPTLPEDTFLAVNASPSGLSSGQILPLFHLENCDNVVLELTEQVPVEDYRAMHRLLQPLRDKGLRLAVDDIGAGYASLRHLLGLSPDIIKLDISLIHRIDADPARRALASALVTFAGDVGATVIAEGIETSSELAVLRDLNVSWGQGFLLARPGPVESYVQSGLVRQRSEPW